MSKTPIRLWDLIEKTPSPNPVYDYSGRWALPQETLCLTCGRSDGWVADQCSYKYFAISVRTYDRYWCSCGEGQLNYNTTIFRPMRMNAEQTAHKTAWVQTGGKAWQAAYDAWCQAKPNTYRTSEPQWQATCNACGRALTLLLVGIMPMGLWANASDDVACYEATCVCHRVTKVTAILDRNFTYEAEMQLWAVLEPLWRFEPLCWVKP